MYQLMLANVLLCFPQLRYMQTLSAISAEKNSTIIFPLPIDILSHCLHQQPINKDDSHRHNKKNIKMISSISSASTKDFLTDDNGEEDEWLI